MQIIDKIKSAFQQKKEIIYMQAPETQSSTVAYLGNIVDSIFDGQGFPGGFGKIKNYNYIDYWSLRAMSMQLFTDNPYCKGIIRRLITNEIHTGLKPEIMPIPKYTGLTDDEAQEWGDDREIDFQLWGNNPEVCDFRRKSTFGQIQADIRRTALISGDCLVISKINKKTGLPCVQAIDGRHIQSFVNATPRAGNKIVHGVEIDKEGRQVAFWVRDDSDPLKAKRIAAYGEKSGRKIAWLVYGSETRLDDVRGEPILACLFYMLRDLDRGRNAELRAFVVNALIPMFIKNSKGKTSTNVVDGGARKKGTVDETGITGTGVVEYEGRKWNFAEGLPGMVPQGLAEGEEPVSFNTQRPNTNFPKFEEVLVNTFSWTLEIPPEVVRLLFQNSYAASRQANNELDLYLQKRNKINGDTICQPIYEDLTLQSVLLGYVEAPGLLAAWRDSKGWLIYGAWMNATWRGISRPSVDILKEVNAADKAINAGIGDYEFWNRRITGQSFRDIVKAQKKQREFARANDLIFSADENQNKEPAMQQTGQEQQEQQQEQIEEIQNVIEEMQDRIDSMTRVV